MQAAAGRLINKTIYGYRDTLLVPTNRNIKFFSLNKVCNVKKILTLEVRRVGQQGTSTTITTQLEL